MEQSFERIIHQGNLIALIIRCNYHRPDITFFTPNDFSQQLAYMNRPKGHIIQPHVHNPVPREVVYTQEVLFIKSGRVRVDFFDDGHSYLESRILLQGDVILLASGGHGFEMLENAEIIEVKQGPYAGEEDKTKFDGISSEMVTIPGTDDL